MTVKSSTDRLSLIVATYNRGPLIARTLDSVFAQTQPPDEIVVADDCSSDGTGAWVRQHYPSVRVVRTERNLYTSGARNFGASQATGNVLAFLDHDDELLPHALETLRRLLRDHPEARAAHADHAYQNTAVGTYFPDHHRSQAAFARLHRIVPLRTTEAGRVYGRALYYALLWGNLLQQPWAVYRNTFLQIGGFAEDIHYCEDWDLYLRMTRRFPVVLSDRVISTHCVEGGNLHLSEGQEVMHVRVLQRQLRAVGWRSPAARWIICQRIARYYKTAGDRARSLSLGDAWRHYMRSLWNWPFDHVVVARSLSWPMQLLFHRGMSPKTKEMS